MSVFIMKVLWKCTLKDGIFIQRPPPLPSPPLPLPLPTTNHHLFYYRQDGIHLCITQSLHYIQYSQGKCRGFSTEMRPWPKHTLFLSLTLYLYVNKRHLWTTMCSSIIELKSVSAAHIFLICFWTIQFSTQVNECNAVAKNFHAYFQCFAHLLYGKWFAWLLDVCRYIKCREYCCFSVKSVSLKC